MPGSRVKSLGQQSRSSLCLIFTRRLLSRDRDRRRNWPRTERRQKVSEAKSKKVSGRRFKTRSVGLVEAETFFCLALCNFFIKNQPQEDAMVQYESNRRVLWIKLFWHVMKRLEEGKNSTDKSGP